MRFWVQKMPLKTGTVGRQQRGGVCERDWASALAPHTSMEILPCEGFVKMSLVQDFPSCIVKFPLHNYTYKCTTCFIIYLMFFLSDSFF